jgi:hypothetical protein
VLKKAVLNMGKKFKCINVKEVTKEQLDFLSDISGLSRSKILEMLIGSIYEIASSFDYITLDFESSVSKRAVYWYLSGHSKINFEAKNEVEQN